MIRAAAARARGALPLVIAALFVLAALEWRAGRSSSEPPHRVVLVDVSRSVGDDPASVLALLDGAIRAAAAGAGDDARVTLLAFDGAVSPLVEKAPARDVADRGLGPSRAPGATIPETDVGAALDGAVARLGAAPGDVVVFSDFAETRGDALAAAARAAAAGVAVHAAPLLPPAREDARLVSIEAPASAPASTPVAIAVTVASTLGGERGARVELRRDGVLVGSAPLLFRGGDVARADFADTTPELPGEPLRYSARVALEPGGPPDGFPENDALEAVVRTLGPPRVLSLRKDGALAAGLASLGLSVRPADRVDRAALAGADAVAIEDVPAGPGSASGGERTLSHAEAGAIAEFVASGGALVAAGAERAFGPGLWRGTPLESVLPVECAPRDRKPLSLLLLVDVSGSMAAEGKLDRAREAARGVLAALGESDRAGLLAFRDRIVAEAPFLPRDGAAAAFSRALDPLSPFGGTRLARAVAAAIDALAPQPGERHLIVLSDGLATDEGDPTVADLARRASEAGLTVTVIATGTDVDADRLRALGRVVVARDPGSIGRRFLEDVGRRDLAPGETSVVAGPDFDPASGVALPFPVARLARTTPKPRARTILATAAGDPVVAATGSGFGSAVAIPVDLSAGGGERLLAAALPLVAERVRAAASLGGGGATAAFERSPDGLRVRVRGTREGAAIPSRARAEPGGATALVRPLGPGRFEAVLPGTPSGDVVFFEGADDDAARPALRLPIPSFPSREFLAAPDPIGGAERLARAGGGRVALSGRVDRLPPPPSERPGRETARTGDAASGVLLGAALALLLAEAALRALRRLASRPGALTSAGAFRR